MQEFVLVVLLMTQGRGGPDVVPGFQTLEACKEAGTAVAAAYESMVRPASISVRTRCVQVDKATGLARLEEPEAEQNYDLPPYADELGGDRYED
jgi:hypothetical protein